MAVSSWLKKIKDFFVKENDTVWIVCLLTMAFIGGSITIFGGDLKGRSFSTPFFYGTFVILLVWLVIKIVKMIINKQFFKDRKIIIFIFAFIIAMFNILVQTPFKIIFSSFAFDYFKKIAVTYALFAFAFLTTDGKFHPILKKVFCYMGLALTLEIAISFATGIGALYHNQTSKNLLKFTFGNSNGAGIVFSVVILMNVYSFFESKKLLMKIIYGGATVFMLVMLYLTHARNAIISIALCAVVMFFLILNQDKKRKLFDYIVIGVAIALPIIIASIYITLATSTDFLETINNLLGSVGKTTTSRVAAWVESYKRISGINFLIGDYYKSTTYSYEVFATLPGCQNSQLSFFVDQGLIPGILSIVFLFVCTTERLFKIDRSKIVSHLPIIMWMFTIFSSIFEAGFFSCLSVWYVFGFAFLALSSFYEGQTEVIKDTAEVLNPSYFSLDI